MSKRDIRLLLEDILDAASKIILYTDEITYDEFVADSKTVDATVRNFEIIGEAASRIPNDFKLIHPELDWIGITGFRNRIIHEYFGIEYETLWRIKEEFLPDLLNWVRQTISNQQ